MTRSIGIVEDHDAVFSFAAGGQPVGISHRLNDPEASPIIDRKRDRLNDVRFPGKQRGFESLRERHVRGCLGGGEGMIGIVDLHGAP